MLLLIVMVVLLITPFYMIYKPPALLFRILRHKYPEILFYAPPAKGEKLIALTIDDSPSEITPELLRILEKYNSHATFFVLGERIKGDILERIVKQKSELGNHGMRDVPAVSVPPLQLKSEIEEISKKIEAVYEKLKLVKQARYYRPGSGWFNRVIINVSKATSHRLVLGDVYPYDAQIGYSWLNARHILSMVRSGSIIICHDGRPWTPKMLDKVLRKLKARGYKVVTITELLAASMKYV